MSVSKLISFDNPAFTSYLFCSGILVLKVLAMPWLIGRHRFSKKIFISPEDTRGLLVKGGRVDHNDPDIERCRRAHLNDIENIPVFFCAAFLYLLTDPKPQLAISLMHTFTLARIAHTVVYAVVIVPQPARVIAWAIGYGITAFMATKAALNFY